MFSRALRALLTPACKSARTLVVPPGVIEYRLLSAGDGGWSPAEPGSAGSVVGRDCVVEMAILARRGDSAVSSANARAFPEKK